MAELNRNDPTFNNTLFSNGGIANTKKGGYKKAANGYENQDNDYDPVARKKKEAEDLRKRRRGKVREVWEGFLQTSTLHGFHYVFDNKQTVRRMLWFSVLVVMAAFFLKEFTSSFQMFYEYPFSTATMTEYKVNLTFPTITICNLNDARELMFDHSKRKLHPELLKQNWTQESKMQDLLDIFRKDKENEIIFDCAWGNVPPKNCKSNYSHTFFSLEGHMCFSLNSGKGNYPKLISINTGLKHGLRLTLNAMQYEYPSSIRQAGFRVILHDYEDIPILQQGFAVSPGAVTFVEIQRQRIVNLKDPYRTNCGGISLKYFSSYARSKCFLEMLTDALLGKCGCKAWFMPDKVNASQCTINQTVNCIWPSWERFESSTSYYDCPVDCEAIQYKPKLSIADFLVHNLGHYNTEEEKKLDVVPRMPTGRQKRLRFLRENFVRIEFYYDELKVHSVEQTPSYDKYKLVGDIGGQLGLMLGASVVTILEFVDLFVLFLYYLFTNPPRDG